MLKLAELDVVFLTDSEYVSLSAIHSILEETGFKKKISNGVTTSTEKKTEISAVIARINPSMMLNSTELEAVFHAE